MAKKLTKKSTTSKTAKKSKKKISKATTSKASVKKKKLTKMSSTEGPSKLRRDSGPFSIPLKPSMALSAIIGPEAMPRTEIVKKLWTYIIKNNLQNPNNNKFIIADKKLKKVFGGKSEVSMFEMTKLISDHLS